MKTTDRQEIINLKNVEVNYGDINALHDINLSVSEGDFMGIIGPNGGGKTTLLKLILGLIKPTAGEVKVFGSEASKVCKQIGYVPQTAAINRNFPISVRDMVLMGRMAGQRPIFHRYHSDDRKLVEYYLDRLDILNLAHRQIGQLSGGQLQRTLIARALVVKPQLLLLDEPTASLDAPSSSEIYSILKELNKEVSILLVTHDTLAVSSYVQSIACINHRLHYHGEPNISSEIVMQLYGCPVELIAHGVPHRVLGRHGGSL